MAFCVYCDADPEDLDHVVKTATQCDLVDGEPCHPCREYFKIDRRVQEAKQALDDLIIQRCNVLSKLNAQHDIIRHFPTEIVSLIFQYALSDRYTDFAKLDDQDPGVMVDKERVSGPLFLGSVCREWRRIALSSPRLWTVVPIVITSKYNNYNRLDLLRSWLARSKRLPLSMRIEFRDIEDYVYYGTVDMHLFHDMIDVAVEQCFRWKELEVQAPRWVFGRMNASNLNLHTLRVATRDRDPHRTEPVLFDNPNLRPTHVALHLVRLQRFNIDWSHVTRISVAGFSSDECVELLRRATRLIDCKFLEIGYINKSRFPAPAQPVMHSSLQTLLIRKCYWQYQNQVHRDIFDSFIFPSMRGVDVDLKKQDEADSLMDLITRSSCPITSFSINSDFLAGNHSLRSFLSEIPTLQHTDIFTI